MSTLDAASRVAGLQDDLEAERRRGDFRKAVGQSCAGAVVGLLVGAAPMVFGSFAQQADVDALASVQQSQAAALSQIQGSLAVLIQQTAPAPMRPSK